MPKVNRIRVSNIKLEKGDKVFGDKTFNLYGNNSIFILENGGGKTSLIQMILQVVLPNYGTEKRKLKGSVQKGNSVHIAVEWIPDDANYEKFITGFSFHNYGGKLEGNDKKKTYDYFNYIIETDYENAPKLEEIEFVKYGKVTRTDELKKDLKKLKGVQTFDTNSDYQDVLKHYGILESEWKNIAKVNGEEGGVKEFFEKAETSKKLIEKLFIPSLLQSVFSSDEERNAILVAFKKYKDSLLELPKLEKDLNDFKVITNHSEHVINACEQNNEALNALKESQRGLSKLYKTVQQSSEKNNEWLAAAEKELEEMDVTKKELEWKLDSYEIFQTNREMEILKNESDEWEEKISTERKEEASLERKVKEQNAAKRYEDYKIHDTNATNVESKLKVLSLESSEKSKELNKCRTLVSENFRYLYNQNANSLAEAQKSKIEQNRIEKEINQKLKEYGNSKEELMVEKTQNDILVKQHEKDEIRLKQNLLNIWEIDITHTDAKLKDMIKEQIAEEQRLDEEFVQTEQDIKKSVKSITDCENEIKEIERTQEVMEREFELFSSTEGGLKNKISGLLSILVRGNLFDDREKIANELQMRRRNFDNDLIKHSIEIGHLEQIKNSIEQRGYHVNSELEAVKDYLTKKGIDVVLGIDLLTKLTLSDEQKKQLVKKNPLLTFAIAIEKRQISSIEKALESYKKELSIPILFMDRGELENQEEKEMMFSLEMNLHVFHRFHIRFNSKDWEQYITDLEKEIQELNSMKVALSLKNKDLQNLESSLIQFWNRYSSVSRLSYSQDLKELEKQLTDKSGLLSNLNKEMETFENKKTEVRDALKVNNNLLTELNKKVDLIQQFNERYRDVEKNKSRLADLITEINLVELDIQNQNIRMENCNKEKERISNLLYQLGLREENLKRDATDYRYEMTETERECTLEEYEKNKSVYKALQKEMTGEEERIEELRENLGYYQLSAEKAKEEMSKFGFTLESFSRMSILFDVSLLNQYEEDLFDVKEKINELTNSKDEIQKIYDKKAASVELLEVQLIDNYQEEAFEYGNSFESEYQLFTEELKIIKDSIEEVKKQIEITSELENENQIALEDLNESKELLVDLYSAIPYENDAWRKDKPIKLIRNYKKDIGNKKERLQDKQISAKKAIDSLMEEVGQTNNHTIISMTRDLTRVLEGTKDNYEQIISTFVLLLDGIKKFEEAIEIRKKQTETGRDLLIDLMYERSELLHKNILEIQKSTQVERAGEVITYFKFNWPKKEDEDIKRQLRDFVDDLLVHLTNLQNKSVTNEELEKEFERRADMLNILNCYADISRCKIEALKPRNELLASKKEWALWDETSSWSNGELHATRMSMFIGFNSHLRKKRYAKENSWKFLVVDNPFGEASSDHVVKPMIDLANKSHTQLFCFTGINVKRIQEEFETVIHNKYIPQRGILFLDSEIEYKKEEDKEAAQLEVLFYAK